MGLSLACNASVRKVKNLEYLAREAVAILVKFYVNLKEKYLS